MLIELNQRKDINEEELNHLKDYVNQIENTEADEKWLLKQQKSFVKA